MGKFKSEDDTEGGCGKSINIVLLLRLSQQNFEVCVVLKDSPIEKLSLKKGPHNETRHNRLQGNHADMAIQTKRRTLPSPKICTGWDQCYQVDRRVRVPSQQSVSNKSIALQAPRADMNEETVRAWW